MSIRYIGDYSASGLNIPIILVKIGDYLTLNQGQTNQWMPFYLSTGTSVASVDTTKLGWNNLWYPIVGVSPSWIIKFDKHLLNSIYVRMMTYYIPKIEQEALTKKQGHSLMRDSRIQEASIKTWGPTLDLIKKQLPRNYDKIMYILEFLRFHGCNPEKAIHEYSEPCVSILKWWYYSDNCNKYGNIQGMNPNLAAYHPCTRLLNEKLYNISTNFSELIKFEKDGAPLNGIDIFKNLGNIIIDGKPYVRNIEDYNKINNEINTDNITATNINNASSEIEGTIISLNDVLKFPEGERQQICERIFYDYIDKLLGEILLGDMYGGEDMDLEGGKKKRRRRKSKRKRRKKRRRKTRNKRRKN